MKYFQAMLGLSVVACSVWLSSQASGQVGRHHQSVESLVENADFVAIGSIKGIRHQEVPAKNESPRLFVQPSFSEVLKAPRDHDQLDELESLFRHSADFYQKLVDQNISGVWLIKFSEGGQVSLNPPGWHFLAYQKLDGYGHSLFAPPMLSNDLSVLTTQNAILTRLRECCTKRPKKKSDKAPALVSYAVPRWLVSPVGAGDGNSMSFVVDEVCQQTAKKLIENPAEICRSRKTELGEFQSYQLESLGLKLLQHFPSEENTVLVRKFLSTPIHEFELNSGFRPRRTIAFEILLRWGVFVDRPSFWETITDLDLSNSGVNDNTISMLSKLDNLEKLNLRNTQVTKAGLEELRPLRRLSLIELNNDQITDDVIQVLREIGLLNAISAVRWKYVDGIEFRTGSTTAINSLDLGMSQLTDEGLKAFSSLEHLVWVNLTGTAISDEGLDAFSDLSQLKTLFVGDTNITDLGVEKIAQFKTLETLAIANLQISDSALAGLESLTRLRNLSLEGTDVSPEAIARLQKVLPNCKIVPPRADEMVDD